MSLKITLVQQNSIHFINPKSILFCQSDDCYTKINLANNETHIVAKSLSKFSLEINRFGFLRVSQSYLVNQDHITRIDRKKKLIYLSNDLNIPFTIGLKELMQLISNSE